MPYKALCLLSMAKNVTVPLSEVLAFQYFLASHLLIRFPVVFPGLVVWPSSGADTGTKPRIV